ncbi:hypothetical protein [Amycolatopsis plumensis]|uniref:Uncharacterized protein n=1 Tax=Amycolatopsis plumensis TaxID=236508 RepID=A0ABV5TVT7_9PSEU
MDRPSHEPVPPPDDAESPLSFPVEAPRPTGPEPGAGAPQGEPLRFPAEASRPEMPVPPAEVPQAPLPPAAESPHPFPGDAQPPTELPYPVAQLPGTETVPNALRPPEAAQAASAAAAPPWPLLRFAAPLLAVVAAVMTALGAFLPLFRIREHIGSGQRFFDTQMLITETAWGHTFELPDHEVTDQPGAPVGLPILFTVVLLVAAALFALTRPEQRLGRWLIAAGAVFGAGVVTTVGTEGVGWEAMSRGDELTVTTAPGMWLLIGGTVVAVAAAVVAQLPRRQPGWADPALAYADTPTPPSGVAITVLPPGEPDEPPQR